MVEGILKQQHSLKVVTYLVWFVMVKCLGDLLIEEAVRFVLCKYRCNENNGF